MPVYWIWFAELKGLRLPAKRQLLETFHDPESIYLAEAKTVPAQMADALAQKDLTRARAIHRQCMQENIRILTYGDGEYPERLRNTEDPPMVLYCRGELPDWNAQPVIGVVGTRKASPYGLRTAHLISAQIAACGGLVVSGAAGGIDASAMKGALDAGRPTVGVLGCGVDIVYPASNRKLFHAVEKSGCLISEYPPGHRPYPWNFLERNRIISGVSEGVLVVEAPEKSGALNTARHAFDQGRDLYVVPGNLGVDTCLGSNALLQEGAFAALSGWDVVKHYAFLYPGVVANRPVSLTETAAWEAETGILPEKGEDKKPRSSQIVIDNEDKSTYSVINKQPASLSGQENAVFALLSDTPQLTDSILDASDLPSGTVQSILTRLAIKGLVTQYPDGRVCKK